MSISLENLPNVLKKGIIEAITNRNNGEYNCHQMKDKRMSPSEVAEVWTNEEISALSKEYSLLSYTPRQIEDVINEEVIGQRNAVSRVVYVIYYNQMANLLEEIGEEAPNRKNLLLIGPTGCGKSSMFKAIKNIVNVPVIKYGADSFTSAGWAGGNVENMLLALIEKALYNIHMAERGIIFLDEIDKKRRQTSRSDERDINGVAVQEELLKILEPNIVDVTLPNKSIIHFDTSRLTFILFGRFDGLDKIKRKRLAKSSMGFKDKSSEVTEEEIEKQPYIAKDFIEYGFISEFVGRILMIDVLRKLETDDILNIIYNGRNSEYRVTTKYLANILNVEQQISKKYMQKLAESLSQSDTGARELNSKITNLFYPIIQDAYEHKGEYGICIIDDDGHYELVYDDITYFG